MQRSADGAVTPNAGSAVGRVKTADIEKSHARGARADGRPTMYRTHTGDPWSALPEKRVTSNVGSLSRCGLPALGVTGSSADLTGVHAERRTPATSATSATEVETPATPAKVIKSATTLHRSSERASRLHRRASGHAETPTPRGRVPEAAATKCAVYAARRTRQRGGTTTAAGDGAHADRATPKRTAITREAAAGEGNRSAIARGVANACPGGWRVRLVMGWRAGARRREERRRPRSGRVREVNARVREVVRVLRGFLRERAAVRRKPRTLTLYQNGDVIARRDEQTAEERRKEREGICVGR